MLSAAPSQRHMLTRVRPTVTCKPCKPTCHHEWGRSLRPRQVQRKQSHSASTQWLDGMVSASPHCGAMPRTNLFQIHHSEAGSMTWRTCPSLLLNMFTFTNVLQERHMSPTVGSMWVNVFRVQPWECCGNRSYPAPCLEPRSDMWHVDVLHVHVLTWVMGQWDRNCQHTALQAEKQKDQKSKPRIAWIWMQMTGMEEMLNIVERATSLLLYIKQCQIAINLY